MRHPHLSVHAAVPGEGSLVPHFLLLCGCFSKLGVLFVGAIIIRALLRGVYTGAVRLLGSALYGHR